MFDIGFWEIILLAVVGLLVFGPERLPTAVIQAKRVLERLRGIFRECQHEMETQIRRAQQTVDDAELDQKLSRIDRIMENAPDRRPEKDLGKTEQN
ncbi:MAG: Sec-independent protein translocase protein TatB [Candidatus Eutrophobiaceae bacterium]